MNNRTPLTKTSRDTRKQCTDPVKARQQELDALRLGASTPPPAEGKAKKEGKRVRLETLIQNSQSVTQRVGHPTSQREQYMFEALRHPQPPSIRQDQNGIDAGRERGTRGIGGHSKVGSKGADGHGSAVVGARSNSTGAQVLSALGRPSTRIFGYSRYYPQREIAKSPITHEQSAIIQAQHSVIEQGTTTTSNLVEQGTNTTSNLVEQGTTTSSNLVLKSIMAPRLPHSSCASVAATLAARLPAFTSSSSSVADDRGAAAGGGSAGAGGSGAAMCYTMSVSLSSALDATTSSNERGSEGATLLPPQAPMSPPPPPPLSSFACQTPKRGHGPTQVGRQKIQEEEIGHRCEDSRRGDLAQMFFHSYGRPDTFARTPRNRSREQQQERERAIARLMAQGQQYVGVRMCVCVSRQ